MASPEMDDIWDEPATVSATALRNEPLFLPSDEEDQPQRPKPPRPRQKTASKDVDNDMEDIVGDMFDDLLDGNDANARPDMSELLAKRAKDASKSSNRGQTNEPNSKDDQDASKRPDDDKDGAPKARRVIAKVDDERLLGERGFPALIKEAKRFKPKGKGHEAEDLDRLLGIYQFWSHNMFPKTQFRDTVDRVERVCRSRRMLVNLSMWRDAERPKVVDEDVDPNKSDESDQENQAFRPNGVLDTSQVAASTPSPPRPPTVRRVINLEDEDDIWADMEDAVTEVEMTSATNAAPAKPKPALRATADDDDLEDWFNADSEPQVPSKGAAAPEPPDEMDIDEPPSAPPNPKRYLSPPREDNWDEDLYD